MPALHRRRLLAGAAGLLAGLAGCSRSTTDTHSVPGERRPENVAVDPDAVSLRGPSTDDPLAWLASDATESDDPDAADSSGRDALRRRLVGSRTEADRIRFADVAGADDARRLVAETDFEAETLYVEQRDVRECYSLELCYVTWSATEIDTQYGRHYRDADVPCEVDARDAAAWLVRVPDALDPDEVRSYGSGTGGGGCRYPPYLEATGRPTSSTGTPTTGAAQTTGAVSGNTTETSTTEAQR